MSSSVVTPARASSSSPKKAGSKSKAKKAGPKTHPRYSEMITAAVTSLKERNGSSRAAILKYILSSYKIPHDPRTVNNFIKMSLRAMIKNGSLKHAKSTSTGASGRFRLGDKKPAKKVAAKKLTTKKPKSASAKPKSPTKKSPAKAKKTATKKTKSPKKASVKPKTTKPKKAASPKKVKIARKASPKKVAKKSAAKK